MLKQAPSLRANSGVGEFLVRRGSKASKGGKEKECARGMPHATCYRLVCNAPLFGDGNSLWRVRGRGEVRACYRIRNALLFGDGKTDGRESQSARQASAWQGKGCLLFWSFSICVLLRRFECMCRGPVDDNPQWEDFC